MGRIHDIMELECLLRSGRRSEFSLDVEEDESAGTPLGWMEVDLKTGDVYFTSYFPPTDNPRPIQCA